MNTEQALALGLQHHQSGRLIEAESVYRQILSQRPDEPDALHLLGVLAHQAGKSTIAVDLIRRAISFNATRADYYGNLGLALLATGRPEESMAELQRSLQLDPARSSTHNNLGNALNALGKLTEAEAAYRQAIAIQSDFTAAYTNLVTILKNQGRLDEAVTFLREVLRLQPNSVEAHVNLAMALRSQSIASPEEIISILQAANAIQPDCAEVYNNMGNVLLDQNHLEDAIRSFRKAISINPNIAEFHNNLGNALKDQAEMDQAVQCFRRAVELAPSETAYHTNLIYSLHFHPAYDATMIAVEQAEFSRRHEAPLKASIRVHDNTRDPNRRLRIGYVSAHFYAQSESFFVVPLLEGHDHKDVEVHCYASVIKPDSTTHRLQKSADVWHDVLTYSDARLANKIHDDRIDILIDLAMHMGNNRLMTFAQKPAPIQIAWLAHPGSTGLKAIDYRLSDRFLDPPGADESWSTEKPLRLPDCWVCYDPIDRDITPRKRPASQFTFGSFNNPCKHNDQVLNLWARALREVSDSRLLLLAKYDPQQHAKTIAFFESSGIVDASKRIEFVVPRHRREYLELYGLIDLALDPFPYNGITTSLDALWMGTPVLTLPSKTPASRAGLGLLSCIGLAEELVARDGDDFVQKAIKFSGDTARLDEWRSTLRQTMEKSPLMDGRRFASNVEQAYRQAWQMWCAR